jgi:hypothetical protein
MQDELRYPFSIVQFFIPEFISRLRQDKSVFEKPSPRQGIAITSLLLPAYMRKGFLSFGDIIKVAVSTSHIENQSIAERLAYQILLETDESKDNTNIETDDLLNILNQKSDDLITYIPSDPNKNGEGELQTVHDSNLDLLKEFSSKPDIGVGPGEDELLKVAVRKYKGRRDDLSRRQLADYLKSKLLKMGLDFQQSLEVSRKPLLRPFEQGDDPDDIDEDRSLENIFDQGKNMEDVSYQDFLIRKKNKKKKVIVFILDISNTMFYELDGLTSIHYSILSMVPLLWSLRKERYGLIFYESNSHIQKDLDEVGDIDFIIDNLLMLVTSTTADVEKSIKGTRGAQTWGGTVPRMSLRWALDQLDSSDSRVDRICFYFSDFVLQDPGDDPHLEYYMIMERMISQGINVIACVSPLASGKIFAPYTRETLKRVQRAGGKIIETVKPSEFLIEIQEILENM